MKNYPPNVSTKVVLDHSGFEVPATRGSDLEHIVMRLSLAHQISQIAPPNQPDLPFSLLEYHLAPQLDRF